MLAATGLGRALWAVSSPAQVWETGYGVDPWTLLAAVAVRTTRFRLGTMLTPLPWRRGKRIPCFLQ